MLEIRSCHDYWPDNCSFTLLYTVIFLDSGNLGGAEINRSDSEDSWESYLEVDKTTEQVDIDEKQFGFMSGWETTKHLFILR